MNFRQTLKFSQVEGGLFALMFASTESFLLYYGVKQNISSIELAILSTLPLFIGALFQLFIPRLISQKYLGEGVVYTMLFQTLGVLGIMHTVFNNFNINYLIAFSSIYYIGGMCSTPLWIDWAQKIIPKKSFLKYLSIRNSYTWWLILFFYISFAFLSHFTSWFKLTFIFIIGSVARILSTLIQLLIIKGDTHKNIYTKKCISVKDDKVNAAFLCYKKLIYMAVFLSAIFKFSIYVSAPFFHPYMINELNLSMFKYVLLSSIPFLGRAIFYKKWGRLTNADDAFLGLFITMLYLSVIPLIWTFSRSYEYLILTEVFAGIFWGGFEFTQIVSISNFVKEESRKIISIQMAIGNFCAVLGSVVGSYCLEHHFSYFNVFYLSSLLRLCVALLLIVAIYKLHPEILSTNRVKSYLKKLLPL